MSDQRIVRVGIEINKVLHLFEGLKVTASGTKYSDPTQNDCSITIFNLNKDSRDFILSSVSQTKKEAPRIILEVGRKSLGYHSIFVGDIIDASVSIPPDIGLTIKSKTNRQSNSKIIVESSGKNVDLKSLAEDCASNNDLRLTFQAKNKTIAGYSFNGTASQQIQYLQRVGNVSCFVDDGELIITDQGAPLSGRVRILNIASGLVGMPKRTPKGAEIRLLIDSESKIGGVVRLESKSDKSLNGDYRIAELKFEIDTHGDNFFYLIEGSRI